jgi:hypothetical protein
VSLPRSKVDKIFARLLVRYGAAWIRMWEGVDMELVASDWARELHGVSSDSLAYALSHLPPERPPTVAQFLEIALKRQPVASVPKLGAPKADPRRVAEALERMSRAVADREPRQWAYDLQERERRGEHMSSVQKQMWREAIARDESESIAGEFTAIPADSLPPAMRPYEEVGQ